MKKIISLLLIIILISSYGSIPATELEQNVGSLETSQSNEILFVSNADPYLPIVAGGSTFLYGKKRWRRQVLGFELVGATWHRRCP